LHAPSRHQRTWLYQQMVSLSIALKVHRKTTFFFIIKDGNWTTIKHSFTCCILTSTFLLLFLSLFRFQLSKQMEKFYFFVVVSFCLSCVLAFILLLFFLEGKVYSSYRISNVTKSRYGEKRKSGKNYSPILTECRD
jgi:hypothetical protein